MLSGTLLSDAVTWLFSSVLKGLQTHGQHDGCMASLVHLAFQIYEALVSGEGQPWQHASQLLPLSEALSCMQAAAQLLPEEWVWHRMGKVAGPKPTPLSGFVLTSQRPRYLEIRAVMEQIPEIQKDSLDQFDCKLLNPSLQKAADKRRKDQFKRLIAGCIGVGHAPLFVLLTPWGLLRPWAQANQRPVVIGHYMVR